MIGGDENFIVGFLIEESLSTVEEGMYDEI